MLTLSRQRRKAVQITILTTLAVLTVWNGTRNNFFAKALSEIECLAGLALSGFDLADLSGYDTWLDESSALVFPETGIFTGPGDIGEYIAFMQSSFFDTYNVTATLGPFEVSADSDTGECEAFHIKLARLQINASMASPTCIEYAFALKAFWTLEPRFNVHKAYIYFSGAYLSFMANTIAGSNDVQDFVCDRFEKRWMLGCLATKQPIRQRVMSRKIRCSQPGRS